MRATAYQQFIYQTGGCFTWLARQKVLFEDVPENHFYKTRFLKETGMQIKDFLLLALCLYSRFNQPGYSINRNYLFLLNAGVHPATIDAFLNSLSVKISDLPGSFRGLSSEARNPIEYLQQTPLLNFPLIRIGDEYCCIYTEVLQRALGHFVYDILKRIDLQRFNNSFGATFENYVGKLIGVTGLPFATEAELIRTLPGEGKVVDFLIADGEANVYIDAKGVEMAQRGQVAHRREVVLGASRTSLVKAIEQGLGTCARVSHLKDDHSVIRPRSKNYLVVVTYKELYVGNGEFLVATMGGNELQKIRNELETQTGTPTENMYFLTIDEFEHLATLVEGHHIGLVKALERAKEADRHPVTRKFVFDMHIRTWPEIVGVKPYLKDEALSLMTDLEMLIRVE